jgi:hypothetical protein
MTQNLVDRLVNEAAVKGNIALGERLIAEGANVNGGHSSDPHYTALVTAAFNGNNDFVGMLLLHGANLEMKCNGKNAREWAEKNGKKGMVDFLDSWVSRNLKVSLARKKDQVVVCSIAGTRTLEEIFNFATRERISALCANPGAPAETMLREPFSAIEDQSGIEKAFALYKEYGGKLTVDDVFPDRIFKAKMPRLGGSQ